jgi:hypothetical protein
MLNYCPKCKERSVRVRVYHSVYAKDEVYAKRVEYCINKGCGYSKQLPDRKGE